MKTLNEYLNENNDINLFEKNKDHVSIETKINKDNIKLFEKLIDYVNKNGEGEFRLTTELGGYFSSIELFDYDKEPGKRYIKL